MNRIRETRKGNKLTLRQLGAAIGVSESTMSLYETEKRKPDTKALVAIADCLGVSIDYLLCRTAFPDLATGYPPAQGGGAHEKLLRLLADLSPEEARRVADFVSGLKAARKE